MKFFLSVLTLVTVVSNPFDTLNAQGVPNFPPVRVPTVDKSRLEKLARCANYQPPSKIDLLQPLDSDFKTCFDIFGQSDRVNALAGQLGRKIEQVKYGNEGRTAIQELYWDLTQQRVYITVKARSRQVSQQRVPIVETQRKCERFCVRVPTTERQCKERCIRNPFNGKRVCSTDCIDVPATREECSNKCVDVPVNVGSKVNSVIAYDFTCTYKSNIVLGKKAPTWNVSCEKAPIGFDSAAITRLINQDSPTLSEVLSTFPIQNVPVVKTFRKDYAVVAREYLFSQRPLFSYVASDDFLNTFSIENAAGEAALAAITLGVSAETLPERVRQSLKAEGLLIWERLKLQGILVAQSEIINLLVTGRTSIVLSNLKFRVEFKNLPIVTRVCILNGKKCSKEIVNSRFGFMLSVFR